MNILKKNKEFRKISLADILSTAGDSLFYLALITYASKLQNYSLAISLIAISESLPRLMDSLFGYYADKSKKKLSKLVYLAIIRTLLYAFVGLLFASNLQAWFVVMLCIIVNFISDCLGTYSGSLKIPVIKTICADDELEEAMGFTNGATQIVTLLAQFLGASLLLFFSYANLAFLNALSFLVAAFIYKSLSKQQIQSSSVASYEEQINTKNYYLTMKSAVRQIKTEANLFSTVFLIAILNGVISCVSPLMEILFVQKKSFIIGSYTLTIAIMGIVLSFGISFGGLFGPRWLKNTSLRFLITASMITSILFLFSTFLETVYIPFIFLSLLGFLTGVCSPKLSSWLMTTVDGEILASSIGIINTILVVITPITITAFTTVVNIVSLHAGIFFLVTLSLIAIGINVIVFVLNKKHRSPIVKEHIHP